MIFISKSDHLKKNSFPIKNIKNFSPVIYAACGHNFLCAVFFLMKNYLYIFSLKKYAPNFLLISSVLKMLIFFFLSTFLFFSGKYTQREIMTGGKCVLVLSPLRITPDFTAVSYICLLHLRTFPFSTRELLLVRFHKKNVTAWLHHTTTHNYTV